LSDPSRWHAIIAPMPRLEFDDPVLEREFRREMRERHRRAAERLVLVVLFFHASFFTLDLLGGNRAVTIARLVSMCVLVPCVVAMVRMSTTAAERWYTAAIATCVAAFVGYLTAVTMVHRDFPARTSTSKTSFVILTIGCGLAMGSQMSVRSVTALTAFSGIGAASAATLVKAAEPRSIVAYWVIVLLSGIIGVAGASALDASRRREFVQARDLQRERARSEALLHNLLPAGIAERLKDRPGAIAERFEEATVLFADLVGFTPLSERMSPEELVALLDEIFTEYDEIAERHGLEKIKTIGDAYMVVGGVPTPRPDHVAAVARMALEMRVAVERRSTEARPLRVRIGMHTGPVVAGVIGRRKFIYDLWGDTVNTASRMESHGVEGGIQVTAAVRARLDDTFRLEPRGTIMVKGKGEMSTYLLVASS
jgi:class 3 adenylate cyclase